MAEEQGLSRSELIGRAARALLAAIEAADKERRYREGYSRFPEEPEPYRGAHEVAGDTMEPS